MEPYELPRPYVRYGEDSELPLDELGGIYLNGKYC